MVKKFKVSVDGETFDVEVEEVKAQQVITHIKKSRNKTEQPRKNDVVVEKPQEKQTVAAPVKTTISTPISTKTTNTHESSTNAVVAPLPGKILSINVEQGNSIKKGDALLVIEAMKMENEILAVANGKIKEIFVNKGDYVTTGQKLIELER